jgi:hypothetical protein
LFDSRSFICLQLESDFFSSVYTSLYWSVRLLVNRSSYVVSSILTFSISANLPYMSSLFTSMQLPLCFTSSYIFDSAILVVDAASLSAVIMVLLSEMPLCISEQYLPYAVNVAEFYSTA